jgi:hypothetical protein
MLIVGLSVVVLVVAGCGSGMVVSGPAARRAVERSGFSIRWRTGPTPKPFVASLYGTAEGKHGIRINFGFLFSGNTNAGGLWQVSLLELVPHATEEGSTDAASVIAISSAGSNGGSPDSARVNEEFHIANTLERKVAKLAPVANAYEAG